MDVPDDEAVPEGFHGVAEDIPGGFSVEGKETVTVGELMNKLLPNSPYSISYVGYFDEN